MKTPRLHNYELVKNTMLNYNESFLRKIEIAQLCGLEVEPSFKNNKSSLEIRMG